MSYTIKDFQAQFATDADCLAYIFAQRHSEGIICSKCARKDAYTPIAKRRAYACACGHQISPCAGTIFHKSPTSLKSWFFAMFLMSTGKNGVSAKEIERHVGVTYKCAWRMAHQIRQLMQQDGNALAGVVETDTTWIGGREGNKHKAKRVRHHKRKVTVAGALEREGRVYASVLVDGSKHSILPHLVESVKPGSVVITDDAPAYGRGLSLFTIQRNLSIYLRKSSGLGLRNCSRWRTNGKIRQNISSGQRGENWDSGIGNFYATEWFMGC